MFSRWSNRWRLFEDNVLTLDHLGKWRSFRSALFRSPGLFCTLNGFFWPEGINLGQKCLAGRKEDQDLVKCISTIMTGFHPAGTTVVWPMRTASSRHRMAM
jgi:hypothetical protein